MTQINYNIHLLLQSKYKILITFLIYFALYISFYGQNISYCMTEGNDIPEIAETKPSRQLRTHMEQLIHREISSYLDDSKIISDQKQSIVSLEAENKMLKTYLRDTAKNCMKYYYQQQVEGGASFGNFKSDDPNDPFFKDDFTMIDQMIKEDDMHLRYRPPVDTANPYYIGRDHGISQEEGDY